jgi:hypothetical protein
MVISKLLLYFQKYFFNIQINFLHSEVIICF